MEKKVIGILECGRPPEKILKKWGCHSDLFEKLLGKDIFDYQSWAVFEGEFPSRVDECQGWLLTGSKFGVYEEHEWLLSLEKFIQDAYQAQVPIYGVCFGHQMIARALGGKVEKFKGGWGLGRQEYLRCDGRKIAINAYHQDQVVKLPPEARVTATSDFCQYAGLAYKGKAASIQPHPEFEAEYLVELASLSSAAFPDHIFQKALRQGSLGEAALNRETIAEEIRQFFALA